MGKVKIAIVHDDFIQWGGAERVVTAMAEIWPQAPVYTSIFNPDIFPPNFDQTRLRASFMQKIPGVKNLYRQLFFLYPIVFESFNFDEFDVVISSTSRFAKSIVVKPQTLHICYCNSPPRFLWMPREYLSTKKFNFLLKPFYALFLPPLLSYLRMTDFVAAQKVDFFIGNSKNVAQRIGKFYQREAKVIYPFVEFKRFHHPSLAADHSEGEYFLIVSRLGGHKRVDLAIEAFNKLGWPLKIIGEGPEGKKYERMAGPNIRFLGCLPDEEVVKHYQNCTAFIYPQEEDFGITALEAQAAGKPVIAYRAGGALETVVEGLTGEFFYPQTSEALVKTLQFFEPVKYTPRNCRENAEKFGKERFQQELKSFVEEVYANYQKS